ncbi:hypothetical protein [Streptomyces sp. NBC_01334]|uniref:hypothetical protein n=1 Tax=Streptomyces sp. NBC_01334 TaxID=2903827 RepID=UPI003FA37B0E
MDVQIRVLQLRRSVLRVVARRGSSPEETKLMHRLAQLSGEERRHLIDGFMDGTVGTVDADPGAVAMVRAATPDLPDDPTGEQVAACVEIAELVGDEDFRARMRRTAHRQHRPTSSRPSSCAPAARSAAGCLKWALAHPTQARLGVWAGTTARERTHLRQRLADRLGTDWVTVVADREDRRREQRQAARYAPLTVREARTSAWTATSTDPCHGGRGSSRRTTSGATCTGSWPLPVHRPGRRDDHEPQRHSGHSGRLPVRGGRARRSV